jgi:hypothetical protein
MRCIGLRGANTREVPLGTLKTTSVLLGMTISTTPGSLGTIKMTLGTLETTGNRIGTVFSSSESIDWTQDVLATAKTML